MEKKITICINNFFLEIKTEIKFIADLLVEFQVMIAPYVGSVLNKEKSSHILTLNLNKASGYSSQKVLNKVDKELPIFFAVDDGLQKFKIFTSNNSFIQTKERYSSQGRIFQKDKYSITLLKKWLDIHLLLNSCLRLHAACLSEKKRTILFTGNSGTGKTTLSNLLESTKEFNILTDDESFLIPVNNKNYVLNRETVFNHSLNGKNNFSYGYPTVIFFLERSKTESKTRPLSKKEAFERLCFQTEFLPYENKFQLERRLEILKDLVEKCQCNLLINGSGLKNDRKKLKDLVLKTR